MAEYNFKKLYQEAFGIKAYSPDALKVQGSKGGDYSGLQVISEVRDQTSVMGTPIFMPCALSWTLENGSTRRIQLPNEPMVSINGSKNIIKSAIDSQEGTFKELYSLNDYSITIRGLIVPEDGSDDYPEVLIRQLKEIFIAKTAIKIECKLTTIFGITQLVIEAIDIPDGEGFQAVQPFTFAAISDKTFNIEIKS